MTNARTRGRPKDESLRPRILDAAREELADAGVEGFSIRRVAARAGVSRNAVAARWSSTESLLEDALGEIATFTFETSGDLHTDLLTLGARFIDNLASGSLDIQLRVAADAQRHPDTFARLQQRVLQPMSEALVAAFESAQQSGQIQPGEVTWLVRAFVGAILARTFQRQDREVPTTTDLRELVDEVLRWGNAAR